MISFLAGIVRAVNRGRFTLFTGTSAFIPGTPCQPGVGYEIKFGQTLDPVTDHPLSCWIIISSSQNGEQTLYGYQTAHERELAELAALTDGVGPSAAHKLVTTMGESGFINLLNGHIKPEDVKVKGVSAKTIAAVVAKVLSKIKTDGLTACQSDEMAQRMKVEMAIDQLGLKVSSYTAQLAAVFEAGKDTSKQSTSHLLSLVLKGTK